VQIGYAFDDRPTESSAAAVLRACRIDAVKTLEYVGEMFSRDAAPVVSY
jgi:hypothetical protein